MTSLAKTAEKKAHVRSLLQNGQFKMARNLSRKLCQSNSHDPESWYLSSLALSQLKEYQEAIQGYRKTLELSPDFTEANFNLALTYQLSGDLTEAIRYYRKAINLNPSLSDAHYNLGNSLFVLGKHSEAAECYKTVIRQRPEHIDARINLGVTLQNLEKYDAAERVLMSAANQGNSVAAWLNLGKLYQTRNNQERALASFSKSLEINPEFAPAWSQIGILYEAQGKLDKAQEAYSMAIKYDPHLVSAITGLGLIYLQKGRLNKAEEYLGKALDLNINNLQSYIGIGSIKLIQGEYKSALEYANKAVDIHNTYTDAIVLQAKIYEQTGNADKALEKLQPLIDKNSVNAAAGAVYANLCHRQGNHQEGIAYLEMTLKNGSPNNWDQRQIHFALGKLYDAAGKYDKAFSNYKKGNDLKFSNYIPEKSREYIDKVINTFPLHYPDILAKSTTTSDKPLFIVGMPRSGTSLVEQILSCHPEVAAGGELTFIHDSAFSLKDRLGDSNPYPECLKNLTVEVADSIANEYLEELSLHSGKESYVTDKLPGNFVHLGLISLLFPSSRIIHCARHPIDTCLSCYFQDFSGDLSFTYHLEHLAHYYMEYLRIMAHWEKVLELHILTVNYEDLINHQEKVSRKIIDYCNLEWNPKCLEFNKSKRFVRTASYDQVCRPIYKSSIGRWKNYERYIKALKVIPCN